MKAGKGPAVGMVVEDSLGIAADHSLADLVHIAVEDNIGRIVAEGKQLEPDSRRLWHTVLLQKDSLQEPHSFLESTEGYGLDNSLG